MCRQKRHTPEPTPNLSGQHIVKHWRGKHSIPYGARLVKHYSNDICIKSLCHYKGKISTHRKM